MVFTWLSTWARRRTRRNEARSGVSASPRGDSPAALSASETEESEDEPGDEAQPPGLGLLPAELILLVSEALPPADAICLALTCKRMCHPSNIRHLARRLGPDATDTLLYRLERDTAGVSYCFVDQKLVRFPGRDCLYSHSSEGRRTRWPANAHRGYSQFQLRYCRARLVTNYQVLGPDHGLPPSALAAEYNHPLRQREHGVCWNEVWAAKLIRGELFVSCTHTFTQEGPGAGDFRAFFSTEDVGICHHAEVSSRWPRYQASAGLPIDMIGNTEHHGTGSCQGCETDWETSIEWKGPQQGWTATARVWYALGACRSPYDLKWQANNDSSKPYRGMPVGAVKATWEQFEDDVC